MTRASPRTPADAARLLVELGASPWLLRHHELVVEAATLLCDRVAAIGLRFDRARVLLGAALHDAGKIAHPDEQRAPGHAHEAAGEAMLIAAGVDAAIARHGVTHAAWHDGDLEDALVALADKLWKGARVDELEAHVRALIERATDRPAWESFAIVDEICEAVAADAPARLARSAIA